MVELNIEQNILSMTILPEENWKIENCVYGNLLGLSEDKINWLENKIKDGKIKLSKIIDKILLEVEKQ